VVFTLEPTNQTTLNGHGPWTPLLEMVNVYTYVCMYIHSVCTYVRTYVCMYICMYICIYCMWAMYICICVHIYVCIYVCRFMSYDFAIYFKCKGILLSKNMLNAIISWNIIAIILIRQISLNRWGVTFRKFYTYTMFLLFCC
jgi:hypothetical protein